MEKRVTELTAVLAHCVATCNYCFNACLREDDVKMMVECIKLDKECAEICSVALSQVASDSPFAKEIIRACVKACEACGEECGKHSHLDHCAECAEVCRECAEACRRFV